MIPRLRPASQSMGRVYAWDSPPATIGSNTVRLDGIRGIVTFAWKSNRCKRRSTLIKPEKSPRTTATEPDLVDRSPASSPPLIGMSKAK